MLAFDYLPFDESIQSIIFHPHILKEFNGRWYMFGHSEKTMPMYGYNIAIDRIIGRPKLVSDIPYQSAPVGIYEKLYRNIIGVTHKTEAQPVKIRIRAHSWYMYRLTETKPIHTSQVTIKPFERYEDGSYGEFEIFVEVNNEFIGRILQMGENLEVVEPKEVRRVFAERVRKLADLYQDVE